MSKVFKVEISKLVVEGRARKRFDHVGGLVSSIRALGLINPITVVPHPDGKYKLVAGECRTRACCLLGWKEIPATLRKDLSPMEQKLVEMEENVKRADLEWTERIALLEEIDGLKREKEGSSMQKSKDGSGWTSAKTAELAGLTRQTAERQIKFAKELKKRPDMKDALKGMPITTAIKMFDQKMEAERMGRLAASGHLKVSSDLMLGRAEELIKGMEEDSVDLLITDPPFGIQNLEDKFSDNFNSVVYTRMLKETDNATADAVTAIFQVLAPELRRVMKPKAHFYIFHASSLYQMLVEVMEREGFEVSKAPLVWDKGRSTAPFMGLNYAASHEPVLFGHSPPRSKRLVKPCRDVLTFSMVNAKDKLHPFEKPQALLRYFIKQSSNLGEVVLDPFAGSGATLVAALATGRVGKGFEVCEDTFLKAQKRLMENNDVEETKTPSED